MRTKLLLLASSVWLLFGIPSFAGDAKATPTPPVDLADWLQVETPMTCDDAIFLSSKFRTEAELNYLRTLPEKECIPPADWTRQEVLDFIRDDFYLPGYVYSTPSDEDIVIEVPVLEGSVSSTTSVASHSHDHSRLPRNHSHSQTNNGKGTRHEQYHGGKYTFRWRGAGRETDHLKSVGKLDHHYDHFHFAYSYSGSIHLSSEERKHHQYRNYATGGKLKDRDNDEDEPTYGPTIWSLSTNIVTARENTGATQLGKSTTQLLPAVATAIAVAVPPGVT
jgi:hypothetical protein